jgi:hypothetical protein
MLALKMGRKTFKAETVEALQAKHREYIMDSCKGAGELSASEWEPKVKDENGNVLGYFSYNSRFWAS